MSIGQFSEVLRDFGPLIGIVLFFIWRDWKREDRLVARVDMLEKYQQDTLVSLVKENLTVIAANTQQMKLVSTMIQTFSTYRGIKDD
jgi:hypothetical protein